MKRCNKEKCMQEELMTLKMENKMLKKEIDNLADGVWILSRQLKEAYKEVDYMKKHFIPLNE